MHRQGMDKIKEDILMEKEKYEWPYKGARDVCWYCGGQLVWDSDAN